MITAKLVACGQESVNFSKADCVDGLGWELLVFLLKRDSRQPKSNFNHDVTVISNFLSPTDFTVKFSFWHLSGLKRERTTLQPFVAFEQQRLDLPAIDHRHQSPTTT